MDIFSNTLPFLNQLSSFSKANKQNENHDALRTVQQVRDFCETAISKFTDNFQYPRQSHQQKEPNEHHIVSSFLFAAKIGFISNFPLSNEYEISCDYEKV